MKNEELKLNSPSTSRWILYVGIAAILLLFILPNLSGDEQTEIEYSEFISSVNYGEVEKVEVKNETGEIEGELTNGDSFYTDGPLELPETDLDLLREKNVNVSFHTNNPNFLTSLLPLLIPVLLIIGMLWFFQKRASSQVSGVMSARNSKVTPYTTDKPKTKFEDVAGYENVKREISEVVDFLKNPDAFIAIGARIPKGVLLVGPPGTGKTLLARAVAGEAEVPFLSTTGSDFMEMFVGVGASRARDLFKKAEKMGKAIIFIDEIDSIGRKRGAGLGGGHDEREQTLNQILSEMDGFDTKEGVVVMAATNRADVLDPALLRPGRFDRQVMVPLPEKSERLEILKNHMRGKKVEESVELELMAKSTPGMSGADLANLTNEAALHAVRHDRSSIAQEDLESARDRIVMGQKRESVAMSEHDRKVTAYHEGGHALLATLLENADPVHKVTILPTGHALGLTMQLPEERHSYTQDYLNDRLAVLFGGRIAEELIFDVSSTGASNDLMQATKLARKMVAEWGMSSLIGPMAWNDESQVFLGAGLAQGKEYSDITASIIDKEIETLLRKQEDRARSVILKNKKALENLAKSLLENETILAKEVIDIVDSSKTS